MASSGSGSSCSDSSKNSSGSSDSGSSSDNQKHKKQSKKEEKSNNKSSKKPDKKPDDLVAVLLGLPNPLNNIAVTTKISINSITSSLTNIRSQSGALSKLSQQITSIFDLLLKVKDVTGLISTFDIVFDKIQLTFASVESELSRLVVDTVIQASLVLLLMGSYH